MAGPAADEGRRIVVPDAATLADAIDLSGLIRGAGPEDMLVFEASGARMLSTPYILTMVSLARHRQDGAPPVVIANPSSAFLDAFTDLGLFQDLMKMEFRT